jgi:hypothetical protein
VLLPVTVKYWLQNRVQRWSPGVGQPLDVSRDAIHQQRAGQYSSQTDPKMYPSQSHCSSRYLRCHRSLGFAGPLIDKADVNPGFLATSPSSYTQVFVLPSMPDEATKLTIDFRYGMLVPQSQRPEIAVAGTSRHTPERPLSTKSGSTTSSAGRTILAAVSRCSCRATVARHVCPCLP